MDPTQRLELTATHPRRATATTLAVFGAIASALFALAIVGVMITNASAGEALDCSIEAPSDACLARLPEELRSLPEASVGVWFYAQNANTKRSPPRYLKAEASWARLLPANATSDDVAKRYDGRKPSASALEGELRMRRATLPAYWQAKSKGGMLQLVAPPLGLGALMLLTAVMGLRVWRWKPVPVRVTEDHVSIGDDKVTIDDLMSIEVAPLRLVSTGQDLALPPDYELAQADHEKLVDVLQTALARSRDMFLDDD